MGLWLSWEPFDWGRRGHEAHEQRAGRRAGRGSHSRRSEEQVAVEVGQRWRAVKDAAARLEAAQRLRGGGQAYLVDTAEHAIARTRRCCRTSSRPRPGSPRPGTTSPMRSPATGRQPQNSKGRLAMRTRDLFFMGACLLDGLLFPTPPKPRPAVRVEVAGRLRKAGQLGHLLGRRPAEGDRAARVPRARLRDRADDRSRPATAGPVRSARATASRRARSMARLRDAEYRDKVGQAHRAGRRRPCRGGEGAARLSSAPSGSSPPRASPGRRWRARPRSATPPARSSRRPRPASAEAQVGLRDYRAHRPGGRGRDEEERRARCVHRTRDCRPSSSATSAASRSCSGCPDVALRRGQAGPAGGRHHRRPPGPELRRAR